MYLIQDTQRIIKHKRSYKNSMYCSIMLDERVIIISVVAGCCTNHCVFNVGTVLLTHYSIL